MVEHDFESMHTCINADTEVWFLSFSASFVPCQAVFRKAVVLHEMGQVDESLQVFLHCLALDEDFPCAKRQVEKVRVQDKGVMIGLLAVWEKIQAKY